MLRHQISSGEVRLSVREHARVGAPTVVLVHGFPDTQQMWAPVVRQLHERHHLRTVTYDIRGAGESTAPSRRSGYHVAHLVDDLVAVLDATCADEPVHLVGHDWGSVQLWDAVATEGTDTRLHGRIASFTSISGPPLDYFVHVLRRAVRERNLDLLRSQAAKSWYICVLRLPWLPELVVKGLGGRLRARLNRTERLGEGHWADTFTSDAAHGINLYRANAGRLRRPRRTSVPVQLVVPEFDHFLDPRLYDLLDDFVPRLTRVDVGAGHWVPCTAPELIADLVANQVQANR